MRLKCANVGVSKHSEVGIVKEKKKEKKKRGCEAPEKTNSC